MTNKFTEFSNIIETYINGNRKEALEQIEQFGWYDFIGELEECPVLTPGKQLEILRTILRIKYR